MDPEPLRIFENPAEDTQARAEIPPERFQNRELKKSYSAEPSKRPGTI
jgi:hypothetical protein